MYGPVSELRGLLEPPGRPRLEHTQRRKRTEVGGQDHGPVVVRQRRASRCGERRETAWQQQETGHVDDVEVRDDPPWPTGEASRRIAKQLSVPLTQPRFKPFGRLDEQAAG